MSAQNVDMQATIIETFENLAKPVPVNKITVQEICTFMLHCFHEGFSIWHIVLFTLAHR